MNYYKLFKILYPESQVCSVGGADFVWLDYIFLIFFLNEATLYRLYEFLIGWDTILQFNTLLNPEDAEIIVLHVYWKKGKIPSDQYEVKTIETILLTHNFAILYMTKKTIGGMFLKVTELSISISLLVSYRFHRGGL